MDSLRFETMALSPEDFKTIWHMTMELARHVPVTAVICAAAAAAGRDWHSRGTYLAIATAALFGLH